MGEYDDAERWFLRALELDPRNPTVLWNLGATLCLDHRYDDGLILVNRSIELGPDHRFAHFAKVVALWLGWGDIEQAAEVLDRAPGPRDATWHEYAFRNACYTGDLEKVARLVQNSPPGPMLQLQRCLFAELTGTPETTSICSEAAAHYRTARDREPDSLWPLLLLARACSVAGMHEEAETAATAAVVMRPYEIDAKSNTDALLVQAQVLGRAGRLDEAVALVEHLLVTPSHLSPDRLLIDPEWASLRHHPRIEEIIHADPPRTTAQGAPVDPSG
jgi:tetratricopeptide (TPR) repeat protein